MPIRLQRVVSLSSLLLPYDPVAESIFRVVGGARVFWGLHAHANSKRKATSMSLQSKQTCSRNSPSILTQHDTESSGIPTYTGSFDASEQCINITSSIMWKFRLGKFEFQFNRDSVYK